MSLFDTLPEALKSVRARPLFAGAVLALCFSTFLVAHAGNAQPNTGATIQAINPQRLAKVVPGITKAQVKALLGEPWRTVQYNDLDQLENEFWEYRGKDAQGTYRIHIEFSREDIVLIVGKIPDNAPAGQGTPAKS
jgi:hypothetical protein